MKRSVATAAEPGADPVDEEIDVNGSGSASRGICNPALGEQRHGRWSTDTKTVDAARPCAFAPPSGALPGPTAAAAALRGTAAALGGTGRAAHTWDFVLNPRGTAGVRYYLAGNLANIAWAHPLAAASAHHGGRTGRPNAARKAWAAVNVTGADKTR